MKSFSSDPKQSDTKENMYTPVKSRNHTFHDDSFLGSSSSKRDTAFQLFCKQNLSPISSFPLLTASNRTPDHKNNYIQMHSSSKSKYSSVFSPGIIDSSQIHASCKYLSPAYSLKQKNTNVSLDFSQANIDEKETLNTILYSNTTRSVIQQNAGDLGKKPNQRQEKTQYVYSSPAFKISQTRNQLEKFFDSDAKIDNQYEFAFQSVQKIVGTAKSDAESYKRVIMFQDENEDQQEGFDPQELSRIDVQTGSQLSKVEDEVNLKGQNLENQQINQLFEDQILIPQGQKSLDGSFKAQIAAPSNETTVKKTIEIIPSSNSLVTIKQKRKLFDSPFSSQKDHQTPSTQKKSTTKQRSTGAVINSNSNNNVAANEETTQNSTSSFSSSVNKQPSIKNQEVASSRPSKESEIKVESEEEENDSVLPKPFNASECIVHQTEEKKICCNCKRTKCLKLYCECFAASRVCEGCSCQGCFNRPEFEDMIQEARNTILERNNSAFDPKIEQQTSMKQFCSEEGAIDGELKAHSKGCNCKKSNCLKKYCECFQLGVKCSKLCKCDHCKNTSSSAAPADEHQEFYLNSAQKSAMKNANLLNAANGYSQAELSQLNYYYPEQYYQYYYPGYPYYGEYYAYPEDHLEEEGIDNQVQANYSQTNKKTNKKKNKNRTNNPEKQEEQLQILMNKSEIVDEEDNNKVAENHSADSKDNKLIQPPLLQKKLKIQEKVCEQEIKEEQIKLQETQQQKETEEIEETMIKENEELSFKSEEKEPDNNIILSDNVEAEKDEKQSLQKSRIEEGETENAKQIDQDQQMMSSKKEGSSKKNYQTNKIVAQVCSPQPPSFTPTTRISLRSSDKKNLKTPDLQLNQRFEDIKTNEDKKSCISGTKTIVKADVKQVQSASKKNAQKKYK